MEVPKIIDDLYAGTLDPTAWDRAILGIADAVRASGAILFALDPNTGAVLRHESHRIDPVLLSDYERYWSLEDFRLKYVLAMPTGEPATEVSLGIPLKGTPLYHEYLLPVDSPHFLPVWLYKSKEKVVALSLQGTHKRGAFEPRDIETIRMMLPHFARAFEIRDRLEAAQVRAGNFADLLDRTAQGVIVLDRRMKILEANSAAAALLMEDSALQRAKDGVLMMRAIGDDRLCRWRPPSSVCKGSADTLVHVTRGNRLPLSMLVLPVPALKASWMLGNPAWVLLLFDPERRLAVNKLVIMRDLGISEREGEVASLLAAGFQIDHIAKRLHVTVHTVRSQLKSTFHKTGCHTQAQLVKRILLGPGIAALL